MQEPLDLRRESPLGGGSHRLIYDVPGHPELLVKVMRDSPTKPPKNWLKRIKTWHKSKSDKAQFRFLYREYHAYIRAKVQAQSLGRSLPVSDIRGLIVTTEGLGMLVEKLVDEDSELAPKLSFLAAHNLLEPHLDLLNAFVNDLFSLNLLANDVNKGNIVLGIRHGQRQFILVDGLGDSHLIPIRSWSRQANQRSLNKRMQKIARLCQITWHSNQRKFSL